MEKTRTQFIDIARGISMICIVLGHMGNPNINRFVFTFHVPIFFLLTGYFTSTKKPVATFIKKKFFTLIIPYAVACVAIGISAIVNNHIFFDGTGDKALLLKWISAALYGAGDSYTEPFVINGIGAIWFLLATFWGSVALRIFLKFKTPLRISIIAGIFILCMWSSKIIWLPLSIQAGGSALFFM